MTICINNDVMKENDPPTWFDKKLAKKLNVPSDDDSDSDELIGFGQENHEKRYCSHKYFTKHTHAIKFSKPQVTTNKAKIEAKRKCVKNAEKDENVKPSRLKTLKTKLAKEINRSGTVTVSREISIYPTIEQKKILRGWFDECTRLYNECVKIHRQNEAFFTKSYTRLKTSIFKQVYGDNEKPCPYDILTDEIRCFCSNLKSCKTNLKNKNIKHFSINKKDYVRKTHCIFIPLKAVKQSSIYETHLGKIKMGEIENKITSDCRLFFDRLSGEYKLITTMNVPIKQSDGKENVVALDPGEKIFMAYYSENKYGKIGENVRDKIIGYREYISKWQKIIANNKNTKNKSTKIKHKRVLKRRIANAYKKIHSLVKELHNKTALFLCKNYDTVLIPIFETSKMVKKKETENGEETELSKRTKFVLNMMSHYKFRQHLSHKCEEYGCRMIVVTEEYTSLTCSSCGHKSNSYTNRQKKCPACGLTINRDINGAKNILIKNAKI